MTLGGTSVPVASSPGQFVLAEDVRAVPSEWVRATCQGWSLWHCRHLPVRSIVDQEGTPVGWLLGDAIPRPGADPGPWRTSETCGAPAFIHALESALEDLAGKYVAIVLNASAARVYPDPGGILSVVYNATERTVASTVRFATTAPHHDTELAEALDIPNRDRYFPFGLTPDRRVRRLLPSHFLELQTFRSVRYWPTLSLFRATRDADGVVAAIGSCLRENVETMSASGPLRISLTAGRDSRSVLAAARLLHPRIVCYTFGLPDPRTQIDCRVARRIARQVGLRHEVVPWVDPSPRDLEEWQERTGGCVGGRVWRLASTRKQLTGPGVRASGLCGEVGRGFYWRAEDFDGLAFSPEELISRLGLPANGRLHGEAEQWLAGLPVTERPDVLDLLYVEQRLGCWAGPQQYGDEGNVKSAPPLCDRRLFNLMLSLSCEYRFAQRLSSDLIATLWPELLTIPFNQEIGLRRTVATLRTWALR
jgi:hypothetical protein